MKAAALASALCLVLPGSASARTAEPDGPRSDELSERAETHVLRAYNLTKAGAYVEAEEEFKRAAFYSPRWRPLHFNLGVLAEAQGKIGTAIREYETFKPHGTADEQRLVEQRVFELQDRRKQFIRSQRGQMTTGAIIVTIGLAMVAGGAVLIGFGVRLSRSEEADEKKAKGYIGGGAALAIYGALIAGGGGVPLSKAVAAKRKLDGIALGPTRLRWTGGAGLALQF